MKRLVLAFLLISLPVTAGAQTVRKMPKPLPFGPECFTAQNGFGNRYFVVLDAVTGEYVTSLRPYTSTQVCD